MKQRISIGSIFTTFAVMLQASPIIFPTVGLLFSQLSTSSIICNIFGIFWYFNMALRGNISPQEAIIFLLTTGPLGLTLGIKFYKSRSTIQTLIVSALNFKSYFIF